MLSLQPALPADRDRVCLFLHQRMNSSVPVERWRLLTDRRWAENVPEFGIVAKDAGQLVGFLGVVYADRRIAGQAHRTGNLTAWFIDRQYRGRGLGLDMLRAATERAGVTYTSFSSNQRAGSLMRKAGFRVLDDRRLLWRGGDAAGGSSDVSVDVLGAERLPTAMHRELMTDHSELGLRSAVIHDPSSAPCPVIYQVNSDRNGVSRYQVLHVGDAASFARHARVFAGHVLPAPGQAVLSADSRFVRGHARPDAVEEIAAPRYVRPAGPGGDQVDFLYSETVLLGLNG